MNAPTRTHRPAGPSTLLELRAEGLTWSEVARRAGCTRDRVVTVLAAVGYWSAVYSPSAAGMARSAIVR